LNPSVNKRFANIREFKNYISRFFPTPLQDFAQFQSNLAEYMAALYADTREEEEKMLAAELSATFAGNSPLAEPGVESELLEVPLEGVVRDEKNGQNSCK